MKRTIIINLLSVLFLSSCLEDKGNYDYREINNITISGLDNEYNVTTGRVLTIDPEIDMTDGDPADDLRFEYYWLALTEQGQLRDTIGTERKLSTPIELIEKTYTLCFKIIDKETGVEWKEMRPFKVIGGYSRGLMLVGEDEEGLAEAQMIAMAQDTVVTRRFLKTSGLPPLRDPISFMHTGLPNNIQKVWILTGTGGYFLDLETFAGSVRNNVKQLIISDEQLSDDMWPVAIGPQINAIGGQTGGSGILTTRAFITNTGHVFTSPIALNQGDYYLDPSNRVTAGGPTFFAKPFMMYSVKSFNCLVWYDTDNERFLYTEVSGLSTGGSATSKVLNNKDGDPFPWNQSGTGRTLIYAENTVNTDGGSTNGNSFALMRDDNNGYFIYKFYANGSVAQRAGYTIKKDIATNIDNAIMYAFSSRRTLMFYSTGNELYAYDYNPGNERCVKLNVGNDPITMIKFDIQVKPNENELYVATYNSSSGGTLRMYGLDMDPDKIALSSFLNEWSGLIKVKNVTWRASK